MTDGSFGQTIIISEYTFLFVLLRQTERSTDSSSGHKDKVEQTRGFDRPQHLVIPAKNTRPATKDKTKASFRPFPSKAINSGAKPTQARPPRSNSGNAKTQLGAQKGEPDPTSCKRGLCSRQGSYPHGRRAIHGPLKSRRAPRGRQLIHGKVVFGEPRCPQARASSSSQTTSSSAFGWPHVPISLRKIFIPS